MKIYFDGFCPESRLKGEQVEMRLNEDDFWESEATGLQIAVFPPLAGILPWRGTGKFRPSSDVASKSFSGHVLAECKREAGEAFFPDEEKLIETPEHLQRNLNTIFSSKSVFVECRSQANASAFDAQEQHLSSVAQKDFQNLLALFDDYRKTGYSDDDAGWELLDQLHHRVYDLKLVFSFDWMEWETGKENVYNRDFDFAGCSLLELSMYLTIIFRTDRFIEGHLHGAFSNGTLAKIFESLRQKTFCIQKD